LSVIKIQYSVCIKSDRIKIFKGIAVFTNWLCEQILSLAV
jgi:hypothetical protein